MDQFTRAKRAVSLSGKLISVAKVILPGAVGRPCCRKLRFLSNSYSCQEFQASVRDKKERRFPSGNGFMAWLANKRIKRPS